MALFGKKNAEEWKKAKDEIDRIFESTKSVRDEMRDNLKLFGGKLWNHDDIEFQLPERSDVQYNLIFATIQSIAPLVTDNRPKTLVAPIFPFMEPIGRALNNVAKYCWSSLDMQMKTYIWVLYAMIMKHGVAKISRMQGKRSELSFDVLDPRDFFRAPGYTDLWDCPFCGWKTQKPISWVKKNFPDVKEIKNAKGLTESEDAAKAYKFGDVSPVESETKFVTVYELWTRDDEAYEEITGEDGEKKKEKKYPYGKICWFTDSQDLGVEKCEDEHGKPPYVELPNYQMPGDAAGVSDVDNIKGIHRELNLLLKYWSEYVRRYHNPNVLVDTSSNFDIEGYKSKMADGGQVYAWDSVMGTRPPPVQMIAEPPLNPEIQKFIMSLPAIAEEISGVTDVTKGQVGKQERQSASELAILLESSHTRVRQKVRNLEWALKRVFYLILRNVQQYWIEPKTVSWQENDGVGYQTYGNSKAQAEDMMKPSQLPSWLDEKVKKGLPLEQDEAQMVERYAREYQDYQDFLEYFKEEGELDPIFVDFEIQVQTDSMLPMDKQGRANTYLRLHAQKAIDNQALLEELDIANAQEIVERMQQAEGPKPPQQTQQDMAAMKANPQAAAQYKQAMAQQGGQQ